MIVNWGVVAAKLKENAPKPGKCRCVCQCPNDAKFQVATPKGILSLCKECFDERDESFWKS